MASHRRAGEWGRTPRNPSRHHRTRPSSSRCRSRRLANVRNADSTRPVMAVSGSGLGMQRSDEGADARDRPFEAILSPSDPTDIPLAIFDEGQTGISPRVNERVCRDGDELHSSIVSEGRRQLAFVYRDRKHQVVGELIPTRECWRRFRVSVWIAASRAVGTAFGFDLTRRPQPVLEPPTLLACDVGGALG